MMRKPMLLFGTSGVAFVIFLFIYQLENLRDRRAQRILKLHDPRKALLRETCLKNKMYSEGKENWEDMPAHELDFLVVDDNHGIIYCFVPKVACTNWKRVMVALHKNSTGPYEDPLSIPPESVHDNEVLTFLSDFPKPERIARMKHYTKFLFVRNPFVRLISAFRDKFQKRNNVVYQRTSRHILKKYGNISDPPASVDEAFDSGLHVSFSNFIQFLVDPETEKDEPFESHWKQMHRLCHPCLIDYDFIGHQETLQMDVEHLLTILNLENDITFPTSPENISAQDDLSNWFGVLPLEDRRKLYKTYEPDFELFGYPKPEELLQD
ncbi:carbohydrate sulfotransferase 12-like [Takifugu rubripes]|uniref:carbohydrate sulfotransferase 12-like n=1 Tax=Takifugu rubripes TaxID=31033 RepID=UPI001145EBF1|nr:carbohydrate sulfotransferase 12-like [Takifugu rubripes]